MLRLAAQSATLLLVAALSAGAEIGAFTEVTIAAGWSIRSHHAVVALFDDSIVLMGGWDGEHSLQRCVRVDGPGCDVDAGDC